MLESSQPDIKLHPSRSVDWCDSRLFRSLGTAAATAVEAERASWLPRARVARGPWTPLDVHEIQTLLDSAAPRSRTIALTRLPDDLTLRVRSLCPVGWQPGPTALTQLRDDPRFDDLMRDVGEYLRSWNVYRARPEDVFMNGHRGGVATTCWSASEAAWVGLHVDDWYNKPPCEREFAPNRLMVNAGCEARHVMFIDRSVASMALAINHHRAAVGEPAISLRSGSPHDVGLEFMETFAEYPVLRLRIDPGEAYIAPTDNIVHDGSTIDMQAPDPVDLVLCAMGYFEPSLACQRPTSTSLAARSVSNTTVEPTGAASKY